MLSDWFKTLAPVYQPMRRKTKPGDHGTKEIFEVIGSISLTSFKHRTTTPNMQQGVQTNATCNIQQCCCKLLAISLQGALTT